MKLTEARAITGGLSQTSKMPCASYGLPPDACKVGSELRGVEGSVCSRCYACKGRGAFPQVIAARQRRLASLGNPLWVPAMADLIRASGKQWFRWHDSGDLQGEWHAALIVEIALRTPGTRHWIPTREYRIARELRQVPPNLLIRVSAPMVGRPASCIWGHPTSSVAAGIGYACPADQQGGRCGDCRACWDPQVENVDYHLV